MTPQYAKSYQEYKRDLDTELSKTAEGFVRIGYLLKVARDTDVLTESPYQTVTEFARAEYGIDKTMVSRFISINDRFSEGGYSDSLQDQYRGYGYTKLTLMLSLPEEINQQLSPAYSKAEIQAIKEEVEEEKNISDLEVMMEAPAMTTNLTGGQLLDLLIRQLGEDAPELYIQMAKIMKLDGGEWTRAAKETMAPNAEKQYSIRISGIGRFLMSIRDTEDTVTATSLRTMEKHSYDYPALRRAWEEILPPGGSDTDYSERDCQEAWETIYEKEYPGKGKVAPVQQEKPGNTESKPAPRKESKVQKAPKPKPPTPQPTPEPKKPGSTGTETANGETYTTCVNLPAETGTEAAGEPARQPETAITAEEKEASRLEEQLPGQIGMEEAIGVAEKRAVSYIKPNISQTAESRTAGQLDADWFEKKLDFVNEFDPIRYTKLTVTESKTLRIVREHAISIVALIEEEILRRGERY